jgi:hypothetical protein
MPVIAAFTFGDALLTMLEFALLVMWIWVAIGVILDIFRSHDMGGFAKAMWVLLIVILPLIGVLIYLIARGHGMHERQVEAAAAQQKAMDSYIRTAASGPADDIAKLEDLRAKGVLSDEEFQKAKAKAIS